MSQQFQTNGMEEKIGIDFEDESIKDIQENFKVRRYLRKNKLDTIKHRLQDQNYARQRKNQSLLFYFLNLCIPVSLCYLNAYILLDLGVNSQLKGKLIIPFVAAGFIISVISNLQIAPWKEVLKLYFLLDSLNPVLISGIMGFFAIFNYLTTGEWYEYGFEICYPIFVFYLGGSLRVMLAYQKWQKWKIIVYKLAVMGCGLIFFYVGFTYMNGAYKISHGYLPEVQQTVKNVVYLYVFGNCDLFFQFYRKITQFDQTTNLKFEYELKGEGEEERNNIIEAELSHFQQQLMCEQIQDMIEVRLQKAEQKNSRFKKQSSIHRNQIKLEVS